ncbi:MAG: MATE family efflux transporter [Candidatus Riflebacteria bacterium]|nr:MATE family efflux transporter [Candidatus Riflebacteria bacterium]
MKSLTRFSWPILVELLLSFSVNMLLFSLLGQIADEASGAVGSVNSLFGLFQMMFLGLSQAGGIVIAKLAGGGNDGQAARLRGTLLGIFLVAIAAVLFLVANGREFFIEAILGLKDETGSFAYSFCTVAQWTLASNALGQFFTAVFRSAGNSLVPLLVALANHSMCFLALWLLPADFVGLELSGVQRIAVSQLTGSLTALIAASGAFVFWLKLPIRLPDKQTSATLEIWPVLALSGLVVLEPFAYSLAQVFISRMFAELGPVALAARAYVGTLSAIPSLFGIAIGWGAQVQVSFFAGAGKNDEARRMVLRSCLTTVIVGPSGAALVYLFSDYLLRLFTLETAVIGAAKTLLAVYILLEAGRSMNTTLAPSLKARGDARFVAQTSFVIMLFICVPLAWLLSFKLGYGIAGLAVALAADELLRGILNLSRWCLNEPARSL